MLGASVFMATICRQSIKGWSEIEQCSFSDQAFWIDPPSLSVQAPSRTVGERAGSCLYIIEACMTE